MRNLAVFAAAVFAAVSACAGPVEYVKVCSMFGAGFHYIPGTDICLNDFNGDARQIVEDANGDGVVWRTLLPYPEGKWVTNPSQECASAKLVKLGTYNSTDFTLNAWNRKQTQPVNLPLKPGEFVSKVIMSGGFYDPRLPTRAGVNSSSGLCIRSMDPTAHELTPTGIETPTFGNGLLPIGCVANSRIANMPAAYAISATTAFPSVDAFLGPDQTAYGPYTYGTQLVITTDLNPWGGGPFALTYFDGTDTPKPMAGTLSAWVCVDQGKNLQ